MMMQSKFIYGPEIKDVEELKKAVGPQTAGIMLTNPSTLGVFEQKIQEKLRAK